MSSPKKRKGDLEQSFELDADQLRRPEESSQGEASQASTGGPVEVSPGIFQIGTHEYVKRGDLFIPAGSKDQVNISMTAKERHLLMRLAERERRSLVSYMREILEERGLI